MATPILQRGMRGDEVRELQKKLHRLGFEVTIDGAFGAHTEEVVIELQRLFGYEVDGRVDRAVRALIDEQIDRGWNARLPDAQELALRTQGKHAGTLGGSSVGRETRYGSSYPREFPRTPTTPDATHTAAPDLAGSPVAPGASKPAGAPGEQPSTTLPKHPPAGDPRTKR